MSDINLSLYRKIYLTRKAEEKIQEHYFDDEMKTPMHMSMGSEAINAGVVEALGKKGEFYGTYRSHALYISVTEETDKFFAEMYGKETGTAKGRAGSMHLASPESGLLATSAVVATTISVAAGTALANKMKDTGKIVAVFFGDGAVDEGTFWETLNFACLMNLPIIFVCEDNDLAIHTGKDKRHGYDSITDVVGQFNCNVFSSESTDAEEIFKLTKKAVEKMEDNSQPAFLHLKYYRYLEHVGVNEDFDEGYRSKEKFEEWEKRDPVDIQRKKLVDMGLKNEVRELESKINDMVEKGLKKAQEDDFAPKEELFTDVYHEE